MKPIELFADFFARHRSLIGAMIILVSCASGYGHYKVRAYREPVVSQQRDADRKRQEGRKRQEDRKQQTGRKRVKDRQARREAGRDLAGRSSDCFLVVEADDLFARKNIEAIRAIAAAVKNLNSVRKVVWLDQMYIYNEFGLPQRLLPPDGSLQESVPGAFEFSRSEALDNPLVLGQLLSEDAKTLLMLVTFDREEIARRKEKEDGRFTSLAVYSDVFREIREAAHDVANGTGVSFRITGTRALWLAGNEAADREHRLFQIIGYSLVFVLSAILFRGVAAVLIVAGAPVLGVFWSFGLLGLLNEPHNGLTDAILPILVIMVGFTDGVHLMIHIRERRVQGASPLEAATSAIRRVGLACALTSLTTAIGFGSLTLSHSELVRGFGRSCALGVVVTFIAVVTFIPLLSSTWFGRNVHQGHEHDILARNLHRFGGMIDAIISRPRLVTGLGIVVTVLLIGVALTLRPDNKFANQLPTGSEAYQALMHCDEVFGGIQFVSVEVEWSEATEIDTGETDEGESDTTVSDVTASGTPAAEKSKDDTAEFVQIITDVENLLNSEPWIHYPVSLRSVLLAMPAQTDDLVSRVPYVQYVPDELTQRYFRPDSRRAVVVARIQDRGIAEYEPVFSRIEEQLARLETAHPGFTLELTGSPVESGRKLSEIVTDLASSLGTASVIILVVMGLVYRSIRIGLITVIPNLFPLVVTAGLLVAMGGSLGMATVCAFTICLGIAVDDTIHFLSRFQWELSDGHDVTTAIRRAFLGVGRALIMTTIVLVGGFGILLLSELPNHRAFGAMACSTIGAALIGDLVLLPAMLTCFATKLETKTPDESIIAAPHAPAFSDPSRTTSGG